MGAVQYANAVLGTPGLIGYWRLGDTAGPTAADASPNAHSGTYAGGVTLGQPGAFGGSDLAADFDGLDGRVEIAHQSSQLLTTGGTLEAWINPRTNGGGNFGHIIAKASGAAGSGGYAFYITGTGELRCNINGGATRVAGSGDVTYDAWNYVVLTWDAAGVLNFYVNGAVSGTADQAASGDPSTMNTTSVLQISGSPGVASRNFDGLIDEVAVYSVELTSAQVADHYAAGILVSGGGAARHWGPGRYGFEPAGYY